MGILFFLKRLGSVIARRRGSFFIEGVLVMPLVLLLVLFFCSVFNYFFVSSFIRHRVDSYITYAASLGEMGLSEEEYALLDVVPFLAEFELRDFVLDGGVLDGDRLELNYGMMGGYVFVRVDYFLPVPVLGDVLIVEVFERRVWV